MHDTSGVDVRESAEEQRSASGGIQPTAGAEDMTQHAGGNLAPSGHSQPRVVVVGAGFAGLAAARGLAHAPVRVTVIDRANHHLFQPLLYQVATAELSPAEITAPVRGIFRDQRNAETLFAEVDGVDLEGREVLIRESATGERRTMPYDYLIVATGAGQSYFGHDEWARYAPGLKSITDATDIRRKVLLAFEEAESTTDDARRRALLTFVVVGGGPTGVELVGALADLAHRSIAGEYKHIPPGTARIVLVEAKDRLLPTFPPALSRLAQRKLRQLGVEVRTHAAVERVDAEGVVIGGERLPTQTVIWAAGVQASDAGEWLHAATDKSGRVIVQDDLTLRDHPEVFVIGDTANVDEHGKPLPGLAPVAIQEGRYVAASIRHREANEPVLSFLYHDKGNLTTVGRGYALAQLGPFQFGGSLAWLIWAFVHIFYLIGFRNRVLIMLQWVYLFLTNRRGVRLITPTPGVTNAPARAALSGLPAQATNAASATGSSGASPPTADSEENLASARR